MVSASWQRRKSMTGWDLEAERHFVTDISILVTCFFNSWKINYTNNRPSQVHLSQQKESKKKTQFTSKENILTNKMINTKKYKTRKYTQVMIHWQRFPCSFMESCDLWYLCTLMFLAAWLCREPCLFHLDPALLLAHKKVYSHQGSFGSSHTTT